MALKWVEEFQKLYPGVRIDVQAGGAGKGIADALAGMVDIGMVSREINPAELEKGAFAVAVTKDAVVPTLSARNPFLKELLARGLKKEEFIGALDHEDRHVLGRPPRPQGQGRDPRLHAFGRLRRGRDLGRLHGEEAGGPRRHRRLRRSGPGRRGQAGPARASASTT